MRELAFWDPSALVPLCVNQAFAANAKRLSRQFDLIVWWGAPVEVNSAFARLLRMKQIDHTELTEAQRRVARLRDLWHEIEPSHALRDLAEELPVRYGLRAADALQLAAAYTWVMLRPANRPFISGDEKLLEAARHMGFRAIAV